ncbi:MAG: FAD-dependent thymidylate synthase [Euryarchaeota archaeon]|nr:FAD-dependent thymidylate synthase [Euryarchaeota archaeon]
MEICRDSQCLKVELIAWSIPREGTVDKLVAESGAISHAPEFRELSEKRVRHLIELLKQLGHESVFEHASFTFRVEGISRVASHQLVRHRLASYTQQSQRYVKLKNVRFIMPESIAQSEFEEEYRELMKKAAELYQRMLDGGIRKEDARFVFPQSIETKIVITMNARELRHFFKLRCDRAAQWEIRAMAIEMLKQVYEVAPILFEDLYNIYVLKEQRKSEGFIR